MQQRPEPSSANARTPPPPTDLRECLSRARQANTRHDLPLERRLLEHAETLQGRVEDATQVQRRLAILDFKYYQRWQDARERLLRLSETAEEPVVAWLALARLEHARRDWGALRAAAIRARETAEKAADRRQALIRWCQASVEQAVDWRLQGRWGDEAPMRESLSELYDYIGKHPGYLTSSRLLLKGSLLLGDGPAALRAWRSYLHLPPGGEAPNAIADAALQLQALLPELSHSSSVDERRAVAHALDGSRFFLEATLLALDPQSQPLVDEPEIAATIAYALYVRELERMTEEHYRRVSIGEGDPIGFRVGWDRRLAEAVERIAGQDHEANADRPSRLAFLERRFGAHVKESSDAALRFDIYMGHAIADETRTVEQYGHAASVRFVVLDLMVSNGFHSWAWESGAKNGGWGSRDGIFQVRPAYVQGPLEAWRKMHDPDDHERFLEELSLEAERDDDRARANPHCHLRGLAMRLHYAGIGEILEQKRQQGLEGEALRLAFLSDYANAVVDSNLFAHEGRHAIDSLRGGVREPWQRELFAKLSQIAFAPVPRLAFGGILLDNLGDGTPHGRANLAVIEGLVAWMEAHRDDIAGFEPARPILPQLDKLTDEQLRSAARSLDPMARE